MCLGDNVLNLFPGTRFRPSFHNYVVCFELSESGLHNVLSG